MAKIKGQNEVFLNMKTYESHFYENYLSMSFRFLCVGLKHSEIGSYLWSIQSTGVHVSLQADLPSCAFPEFTNIHIRGHTS